MIQARKYGGGRRRCFTPQRPYRDGNQHGGFQAFPADITDQNYARTTGVIEDLIEIATHFLRGFIDSVHGVFPIRCQ
jgi:hypothetical protein